MLRSCRSVQNVFLSLLASNFGRSDRAHLFTQCNKEMKQNRISSMLPSSETNLLVMKPIAYIKTPFIKKTGCPRQPQVCPSSIGKIVLTKSTPNTCIDQLSSYSHLWVIFTFDNNTDVRTFEQNYKSKITPPRIEPAGTKVGCLSTRTPHRPNNIGLSLLKMVGVDGDTITVSGVDLCDGTPIYDVKPCVPWDIPGYVKGGRWGGELGSILRCPDWVWDKDAIKWLKGGAADDKEGLVEVRRVEWNEEAVRSIKKLVEDGAFEPLYESRSPDSCDLVKAAITEILIQDPRHNRQKGRETGSEGYRVVFCSAAARFFIEKNNVCRVTEVALPEWEAGDGRMMFFKR